MRLGELCGLKWGDIDFHSAVIRVRRNLVYGIEGTPKSGRGRDMPMHPLLAQVLHAHRHLRSEHVFCTPGGKALTRNTMRKPFRRILRAAGLREIRLHDIRHSFASQLVINGQPLKAVQELLGHADIRQTMIYAHLSPQVNRDAICTLRPVFGALWDTKWSQNGSVGKEKAVTP